MGAERDEPVAAAAPAVDVTMPDGQVLRGRLYSRRQVETGWVYRIGLVLWQAPTPDRPVPGEYRTWVPVAHVASVPGADYSAVPTKRLTELVPLPPVSAVQPAPATRWLVDTERLPRSGNVQPTAVHRADCWAVANGTAIASLGAAREAMARPGARGCIICGTDMSLA
ncbi:DUF6233 domain-containing protein [Streptomyces sp. NPDC087538]|uniref:DUF6233 domain-containing protein n=1 Tax=Streptomyces sp. NPDC087538 TaxID=3365797 RepID=UPI00381FEFED